jgi:hypothetical protein
MSTGPISKKTFSLVSPIFINSSNTLLRAPALQASVMYAFIAVQKLLLPLLDKFNESYSVARPKSQSRIARYG